MKCLRTIVVSLQCNQPSEAYAQASRVSALQPGVGSMSSKSFSKFIPDCDGLQGIFTQVHLYQLEEQTSPGQVRKELSALSLKPGNVIHVVGLIATDPGIADLPDSHGPIVALESPSKKWCGVLVSDHRGPKFADGLLSGPGWRRGAIFIAVPKNSRPVIRPPEIEEPQQVNPGPRLLHRVLSMLL